MNIKYIEIGQKDVYIEYEEGGEELSGYFSFSRARKMLYVSNNFSIRHSCVDSERSVKFLNSLLGRFKTVGHDLVRRDLVGRYYG